MNADLVDRLVNAVLYEGYILYPYRPSATKNQRRFTFGRVYPYVFSQAQRFAEPHTMQTQCLLHRQSAAADPILAGKVRFLHPIDRCVGQLPEPLAEWPDDAVPEMRRVASLRVGDRLYQSWQEATERTVALPDLPLNKFIDQPWRILFTVEALAAVEPIRDNQGRLVGAIERQQYALDGAVTLTAEAINEHLVRVTAQVQNQSQLSLETATSSEDKAVLLRTFVAAHIILTVQDGEFVSLIEPPHDYAQAAATCHNQGIWPILVGDKEQGQRDTLLASPIILYDYPEIAPESQGDLFDSTEIDEILTLRILTMTDDEKWEMSAVDERARQILQRTEAMQQEDLIRLHGTLRGLRPSRESDQ